MNIYPYKLLWDVRFGSKCECFPHGNAMPTKTSKRSKFKFKCELIWFPALFLRIPRFSFTLQLQTQPITPPMVQNTWPGSPWMQQAEKKPSIIGKTKQNSMAMEIGFLSKKNKLPIKQSNLRTWFVPYPHSLLGSVIWFGPAISSKACRSSGLGTWLLPW